MSIVQEAAKILSKHSGFDTLSLETFPDAEVITASQALKAMDEYCSSETIAFVEWKERKGWWADEFEEDGTTRRDCMRWSNDSVNPQYLTTEQLYNLFKQEKK